MREERSHPKSGKSVEVIPEDMKGQGKFYRMASPGGREGDLTPWQAERAGEIGAPLLAEVCSRRGPAG